MAARANVRSVVSDAQDKGREAVEAVSEVRDNVAVAIDKSLKKRRYTTLALTLALGFLLGAIWARESKIVVAISAAQWEPTSPLAVELANRRRITPMNEDRLTGNAKNFGGQVEEGFGRATGDVKTQLQGKAKQAEGALQDVYGQAKEAAATAADAGRTATSCTGRTTGSTQACSSRRVPIRPIR